MKHFKLLTGRGKKLKVVINGKTSKETYKVVASAVTTTTKTN